MEFITNEKITYFNQFHESMNGKRSDKKTKNWKKSLMMTTTSSGNKYYILFLGDNQAHIYFYNEYLDTMPEFKIYWANWKEIPEQDKREFEMEKEERKWEIHNENARCKRLLHVIQDV